MTPSRMAVVRSAYGNAGDHMITDAVSSQLSRFEVPFEILERPPEWDVGSKQEFAERISRAGAVCLAGGPMISEDLFESFMGDVLGEHLGKTFFYAVGRSDGLNRLGRVDFRHPRSIRFSRRTRDALAQVLGNGLSHSVRDSTTFDILNPLVSNGSRVLNTGCPVMLSTSWPQPIRVQQDGEGSATRVLLTAPAREQKSAIQLAKLLSHDPRLGPIRVFFQAGVSVPPSPRIRQRPKKNYLNRPKLDELSPFNRDLLIAANCGSSENLDMVQFVDSAGDSEQMRKSIDWADLVVGFRVHAHLYALSQSKKSVLIAEDLRGYCQVADLNSGSSDDYNGEVMTSLASSQALKGLVEQLTHVKIPSYRVQQTIQEKQVRHDKFIEEHLSHNLRLLGLG